MEPTWDETQIAILEGAIRCIYKNGFQKLTTKCIADEAGVNEVTIFRRFGNKATVLDAVFTREAQTIRDVNVQYTGNIGADLTRVVSMIWQVTRKRQSIIPILLIELSRNPDLYEFAQPSIRVVGQLTQTIQKYQDEGQLKPGIPLMIFSALIGPLIFSSLVEGILPLDGEFDVGKYVQDFLNGYQKR
ncbi:MAG: TetR/AcrR family transcriptional regulator [Anaerolineaceae bacterium]|nr:TetR/AcrR family transcriptional regulator [Anaerolineaceae bacterium]